MNDALGIYNLGCTYSDGEESLPQDHAKALELWHRAAKLGCTESYYNIADAYENGDGVERDEKKAKYYYELAAMEGDSYARFNLGCIELQAGNMNRSFKHWMISASCGVSTSLENIKLLYERGFATKDDYANALRSYQAHLHEIRSDQRDEAAAFKDGYKYY